MLRWQCCVPERMSAALIISHRRKLSRKLRQRCPSDCNAGSLQKLAQWCVLQGCVSCSLGVGFAICRRFRYCLCSRQALRFLAGCVARMDGR